MSWHLRIRIVGTLAVMATLGLPVIAQDSSGNQNWSTTSQQGTPGGAINPTRTSASHSESGGRVTDRTSVETMGPDGRYVPYLDTEKESVKVNDLTVRTIERTFAKDANGNRTLVQERQEETRQLAGGEEKISRTISNPDSNGGLQVVQREVEDSKQISAGVRMTSTTVMTPDGDGKFAASVQSEQREAKNSDGTIDTRKSTRLADGVGGWKVSEVRESKTKQDGPVSSKDERVLRPDGNGNLAVVERTLTHDDAGSAGGKRGATETYSTNVPGVAGDDSLQLVRRETTVQRAGFEGAQSTTRQVEQARPGAVSDGLQMTEQAIDIVRPGSNGTSETRTILTTDANGQTGQVWVDMSKSSKAPAAPAETKAAPKKK